MLKLQRRVKFTPGNGSRVRKGGSLPRASLDNRLPAHPPRQTLTELWMGWIGEEHNARADGYSSRGNHRVHKLRVKGHIAGPQRVTGVVTAEDDSAVAVVVVLVPGVDDDRPIWELIGLRRGTKASGRPREGAGQRALSLREQGWWHRTGSQTLHE